MQGVSKRIRQDHHAICEKRKALQKSCLDTYVVHIFEFFFLSHECSMWPPSAARTTPRRYENSSQTWLSMSRSTVLIAAVIRCFMSSISARSGGTQTLSLIYPYKKTFHTVKSGELASQRQRAVSSAPLLPSVFFKLFWGTETVSQISPAVSQNLDLQLQ